MTILRRMGLFWLSVRNALIGQFFARSFCSARRTLNVNRIAYLLRVLREKMRESWLKIGKIKTIFAINEEMCCK